MQSGIVAATNTHSRNVRQRLANIKYILYGIANRWFSKLYSGLASLLPIHTPRRAVPNCFIRKGRAVRVWSISEVATRILLQSILTSGVFAVASKTFHGRCEIDKARRWKQICKLDVVILQV